MTKRAMLLALMTALGCGGQEGAREDVVEPGPCPECGTSDVSTGTGGDENIMTDEKEDEIKKTFQRKKGTVARCYVEGFEAGEVEKTEKGFVTVALTIDVAGKPQDVRVEKSSFSSAKVGECVVRMVRGWTFPMIPKAYPTSHTYVLDRL